MLDTTDRPHAAHPLGGVSAPTAAILDEIGPPYARTLAHAEYRILRRRLHRQWGAPAAYRHGGTLCLTWIGPDGVRLRVYGFLWPKPGGARLIWRRLAE